MLDIFSRRLINGENPVSFNERPRVFGLLSEKSSQKQPFVDGRDKVGQKWSFKNGPPG